MQLREWVVPSVLVFVARPLFESETWQLRVMRTELLAQVQQLLRGSQQLGGRLFLVVARVPYGYSYGG